MRPNGRSDTPAQGSGEDPHPDDPEATMMLSGSDTSLGSCKDSPREQACPPFGKGSRMIRPKRLRRAGEFGAMAAALILSLCGAGTSAGSPSAAGRSSASTAELTSETVPQGSAGTQLAWFLRSVGDVALSQEEIDAHFDVPFREKASAAKVNLGEVLAEVPAPGTLVGVLSSEPTGLVVIASFGTDRFKVTLSVDGSGLIDGLKLVPSASVTKLVSDRPGPDCSSSQRQLSCRTSSSRVLSADPPVGSVDATPPGIRVQALCAGGVGASNRRRTRHLGPRAHGRRSTQEQR